MSTNESTEARRNAILEAMAAFPEADTNTTPTVYDPSPIPRAPFVGAEERSRRDVNTWSADITDRSQKIEPRAGPRKVNGPSTLMLEVIREMRSPLCPPTPRLLSSPSDESTELSHVPSSSNSSQFETSSEVLMTMQMDKCLSDANFGGQKRSQGEVYQTRLANKNAKLQRADDLIARFRAELEGQRTEVELAKQMTRQKRKRLEEFFDDITLTARNSPERLLDEIADWRKALGEYVAMESVTSRTHEVGALLEDARAWRE